MKTIEKISSIFRNVGKYISGIAILLMMLVIVADVFMRNIFGNPISGTYEIVQFFLMPIAVFPALGYVYWVGVLPRLSEIVAKAPKGFRNVNRLMILVIDLIVFVMLTYYSVLFAVSGFQNKMAIPVAGELISVWPIYFFVPLGFFFVVLEVLLRFFNKPEEHQEEVGI
ncbi:TRAP transporter small permease [Planomicrobium sp. YIM 101495]|uniref:TRAP transporter small permease n=1 Tax=Planomicrobium sp. YIM 101495 TaxID=2665160 RepID=UPI0012B79B63|nr:TRAP transporter small permease [Planomicrobium sp. YIM 101495]MTD30983.1 TRAP transporter small permease subunit [Planomicrobium sp. YIM 101495]